ncbi:E3 ubiquitin-protein ligase TRIM35-like [Rhinichthys klamathensis goyatoka]|uniref:E3 ubiquitin-protein ligase TRIM35-like n=1 Tax=Rhinichthys klamathensis goyatoka TaxID=3034132 RepID=UPI0024B58753|nr:E3 ubiquitin-protein ligase TRIM35-like [Rhinichthys klamathensis goyatoka]
MASKRPLIEEDFTAATVCAETVPNSTGRLKGQENVRCAEKEPQRTPPLTKNLCQAFLVYRGLVSEELCEIHRERLSLFCLHDEQLVCLVCRESLEHKTHTFRPVSELAEERKRLFRRELSLLTRKLRYNMPNLNMITRLSTYHQVRHTKDVIREDFKHLHQLLYDEEEGMLAALNEEQTQKKQLMKDKIEKINAETLSLSGLITELRGNLDSGEIQFLQKFKDMMKRAQDMNQDPDPVQGVLIDTAQYLGNLKFTVWSKIRLSEISYSPVVLDPNTANSQLILSEDLTSLRDEDEFEEEDAAGMQRKQLPTNPERFDRFPCVLGSVGYSSGTHIWDVDVGDSTFWMLGVTTESVRRKGATSLPSEVWCVGFDGNTLSLKAPQESCIPLLGCEKPKRVRVKLDLDEEQLSFTDPLSNTLYYTFTTDFMEKVFPFFCNLCSISPLRIVPVVKTCN